MTMEKSGDDWLVDDMHQPAGQLTHRRRSTGRHARVARHPQFWADVLDLSPATAHTRWNAMRHSRGAVLKAAR